MPSSTEGDASEKPYELEGTPKDGSTQGQEDLEAGTKDKDPEAGPSAEDEGNYPGPFGSAMLMLAISVATFLVSLDRTIVATAVARISDEFNSFDDIGWYAGAYALAGCAMQLPLGRFYSFYTPKYVYIALISIFIVGSAIGAGAPNSATVIVGRAIQGFGCAGVFSGSIILLLDNVPIPKRPMFVGGMMATMSISAVVGPLIGGALTSNATWRWCFIINIPIGLLTIAIVVFTVKNTGGKEHEKYQGLEKIKHLDPLGAFFLIPAVVCLVLALQWGGSEYDWSNWRIIVLLVFAGLLGIAFVAVQIVMPDTATVAPRVIKQRCVSMSFLYATMSGGAMLVVVYWLPVWFQAIKGASPVKSGEMTIPLLLSQTLASVIAGMLVSKLVGYAPPFMIIASVMMAIGAGMFSTFTVDTGSPAWIGYQVLFGFGLGLGQQQPSNAVQAIVNKEDFNSAVSLFFFGMQLGGSICVCIGQNVLNQKLIKALTDAAIPGLDPYAVLHTGATELQTLVSNDADLIKLQTAYNSSLVATFYVAAAVGAAALFAAAFIPWKSIKGIKKF